MSQVADHQETLANDLGLLYAPIEDDMAEVERILDRELRSSHQFVDELVRYGCMLAGKRLRPALLLLAAKATGKVAPAHHILAAVVEMIHTATLVHDDVLDEADKRRHLTTVNARWNNESSVLLGDFLFTHSFYLASTLETTRACQIIGRTTNIVCEGELRQIGSKGNFALSEQEYFEIIEAKTAELCACCCQLGAIYAQADDDVVDRLTSFGRNLGVAFQITDDLLDVLGEEHTTGKSLGTDLEKRKPTLPLIHTFELAKKTERKQLLSLLNGSSSPSREELMPWFARFDAIEYSRLQANAFAQQAVEDLESLPSSPALEVLKLLPEFAVARSH